MNVVIHICEIYSFKHMCQCIWIPNYQYCICHASMCIYVCVYISTYMYVNTDMHTHNYMYFLWI